MPEPQEAAPAALRASESPGLESQEAAPAALRASESPGGEPQEAAPAARRASGSPGGEPQEAAPAARTASESPGPEPQEAAPAPEPSVELSTQGVGPWPGEWPAGEQYDPELLERGDSRNVVDRYRYWRMDAIVADLDTRRHPFHVAIENWQHDLNIGSIVRTANAFLASEVHIVGRRRWNRRGAMVTDRYQHVRHHESVADLVAWAAAEQLPILAVDNVPGSVPVERFPLPERCVLLFGQEGPGLSPEALAAAAAVVDIPQFGSTRSINASAAAAIVMHEWIRTHALP